MFYLPQAVAVWVVAIWLIRWKRLRELLVFAFYASFLCAVQDQLGRLHGLWEYRDTGPIDTHTEISILIALSAAPLFGMHFVQELRPESGCPLRRIATVTTVAMIPETIGLFTENIIYGHWWNYGWSVAAHVVLWISFYGLHRWLTSGQE
ncbi:MAG TPA: CBO0543 family protein [Candidatus Sulfotelmatobacter sp.]|nr:CBO0543 family protein [Candidatus Sulfotelmatobacter sp.]